MTSEHAEHKRHVYILAGPNGAGKTTFASEFLPGFVRCREFLNADLIASGLSPFAPETQNRRAGRILLERMKELVAAGKSFGFETTLAGRSYAGMLERTKAQGYRLHLFYLWLPTPDLAVQRVASRVRQGGHRIPEADIRRRYGLGLRNLFRLYRPLMDEWSIYDASRPSPKPVVASTEGREEVMCVVLYEQIVQSSEQGS